MSTTNSRAGRLLVSVVLMLGLSTVGFSASANPGAQASRPLASGEYYVLVVYGPAFYDFHEPLTWTLRKTPSGVTYGESEGTSRDPAYVDSLTWHGGATVIRHCGPEARAVIKGCTSQTFVVQSEAGGIFSGTVTGPGVVDGTTFSMQLAFATTTTTPSASGTEKQGTISGKVSQTDCSSGSGCSLKPLPGVTVTASGGPGGTARASTNAHGGYSLSVDKGTWTVTPSKGDREFSPPAAEDVTVVSGSVVERNFVTCALAERDTQSARAPKKPPPCPELELSIVRIKAAGDRGWTQTSGKKFSSAKDPVPVGFGEPKKNGDFRWQCQSGCYNIRVHVQDAKTGLQPKRPAEVSAKIVFEGHSVDPLDREGALCKAARPELSNGCAGVALTGQINAKTGDFDLYYWVPGVIEPTSAILNVEVKSTGYPAAKGKVTLDIKPNIPDAFMPKQITFEHASLKAVQDTVPVLGIGNVVELSNYCGWFLTFATFVVTNSANLVGSIGHFFEIPSIPDGYMNFFKGGLTLAVKAVKTVCGAIDVADVVGDIKKAATWSLYWYFGAQFGLPPSGLVGPPSLVSFVSQWFVEYSQFLDAFTGGFLSYYANRQTIGSFDDVGVRAGDTLKLTIYEVSHRRAHGDEQDALYVVFSGQKRRANGVIQKIEPIEKYVEDGYFAGCWLNPKLNQQQVIVVDNICKTEEEEAH